MEPPKAAWTTMAFRMAACVKTSARADLQLVQAQNRPGRAARAVEPNGLAGRCERGVRQRESQRFAHDLRGCRGAKELASAPRSGAGAAADLGGVLER